MQTAVFESSKIPHSPWNLAFTSPIKTYQAYSKAEVVSALEAADLAAKQGYWAIILLTYESAASFDSAYTTQPLHDFPLAHIAVFEKPIPFNPSDYPSETYEISEWKPQISPDQFNEAIHRIKEYIRDGDTYQVNYTFAMTCRFQGNAWSWYNDLTAAQRTGYCAYIDLGKFIVISCSPELFFERNRDSLITRPMKGTSRRGRWIEEDIALSKQLATSRKNQAENVMIVDLLRSDLGKISQLGSVQVKELFAIEKYDTLFQMTSTIESRLQLGITLSDIFTALFPCGSITGAPKIRTMEIIQELEPFPRSIYTGTIGFVRPGGDGMFNVAIRTILLNKETGNATFGVGAGITYDSVSLNEYEECILKAKFLTEARPAFSLFESILLESGEYFLLERHLDRLRSSAAYFDFTFHEQAVRKALDQIKTKYLNRTWKIRIFLAKNGQITTDEGELLTKTKPIYRVKLAKKPVESDNPFLFHKTTHRQVYDRALQEETNCDDVILWNEKGEITESTIANIVMVNNGNKFTPPRTSGLLIGTFRNELIAQGEIKEKVIYRDDLFHAEELFLINSVRKWMPAIVLD